MRLLSWMVEIQESETTGTSAFDVSGYVMFTNVPLDEASDMVDPNIKGLVRGIPREVDTGRDDILGTKMESMIALYKK